MSDAETEFGKIGWVDLTVVNASEVRDFYTKVCGWTSVGLDMGGYEDFVMKPSGSAEGLAGVCHARGGNADMPPQWLMYVTIPDLYAALEQCREQGGSVVTGPKSMGKASYAVIKDPAGAVMALYQAS